MTVPNEVAAVSYAGNGSATRFDFPFKVFDPDHVSVVLTSPSGEIEAASRFRQYSVSGVGDDAGYVTYPTNGSPLPTGWRLTISRDMPITQDTDLKNQGPYLPEAVEMQFDKLVMILQQLDDRLGGAISSPAGADFFDALGRIIRNLGDPERPGDAANARYVDSRLAAETATWEVIKIAARQFAAQALGSATEAGNSANQSQGSALAAERYYRQAVTASEASGDVRFFDNFAQASSARLNGGQVVEIFRDETRFGRNTRYRFESGTLVYKQRGPLYSDQPGIFHSNTIIEDPIWPANSNGLLIGPVIYIEEGVVADVPEGTIVTITTGTEFK